jgi:hypothetical protein
MGFTLSYVEQDFESTKNTYLADMRSSWDEYPDLYREEVAILSTATFSDFLAAFREIVATKIHPVWVVERVPGLSTLVRFMLKEHGNEDYYWSFPCSDMRCFFRALIEVVPESAFVTQELTDLVAGEYFDVDARMTELALEELKGNYSINSSVIVLTEGITDSECIQAALELLHPELSGYYSFMDLAVRSPGGASSLVHVVKAFAGAGIENRVVAIFDNDTAGHSALSLLKGVPLPKTIRTLHYPDTELARTYPTIGPTGAAKHDVNGAACSIELYFGKDVLEPNGSLVPVQWRGFDDRMKRYQGEVLGKDALKSAFLEKAARAKGNPSLVHTQDWADMEAVLDTIFDAFNL